MLQRNTAIPLVCTVALALSFILALSYIAVMESAPAGRLEVRFRYLEKHYNRGDNNSVVNFSVKAGITSNNVSLQTRETGFKSVLIETAATTPITISACDQYGFTWDHTVTVLELIDEHWIDLFIDYRLGDKYNVEICFSWSRFADKR